VTDSHPVETRIQVFARREVLVKLAAVPLALGFVLQLAQGWASVAGDVLWIVATLIGASQALFTWAANRTSNEDVRRLWPLGFGWLYMACVFGYWLLVDADLVDGASTLVRVALLMPIVPFVVWYLRVSPTKDA
jgi:hypothetical protein